MLRPRRSTDDVVMPGSSLVNVPFSWENKPGKSKIKASSTSERYSLEHYLATTSLKLTPPPRLSASQRSSSTAGHRRQEGRRGGPCLCSSVDVHQPTAFRNSFGLNGGISPPTVKLEDDPFFVAFIKCTQMPGSRKCEVDHHVPRDRHHAAAGFSAGRKNNTMFLVFTSTPLV